MSMHELAELPDGSVGHGGSIYDNDLVGDDYALVRGSEEKGYGVAYTELLAPLTALVQDTRRELRHVAAQAGIQLDA